MKQKAFRHSGWVVPVMIALMLCVVVSLVVLFDRLSGFASPGTEFVNVISLTDPARQKAGAQSVESPEAPDASDSETSGDLWLGTPTSETDTDGHTIFHSESRAEIFRAAYENDQGLVTVLNGGAAGDRLIAPGTSNRYVFTLRNTTEEPLDYDLTLEAIVRGTEQKLPLQVRLWDHEGSYLLGAAQRYDELEKLSGTKDQGVLGADRNAVYTLEWTWPFEQGMDEYDTLLGNLAEGEEISLQIIIRTTAMADPSPESPDARQGGIPTTGDNRSVTMPIGLLCGGAAGTVLLLLLPGRRRKKGNAR